jgi:hypothetical protein
LNEFSEHKKISESTHFLKNTVNHFSARLRQMSVPSPADSASIYDIEREIKAPGPNEICFPECATYRLLACLSARFASPPAPLSISEIRFEDGLSSVLSRARSCFPFLRQFPTVFSFARVLPIASDATWLVLLGLLEDAPEALVSNRTTVFDSLSVLYTDLRQSILENPVQMQLNLTMILAHITAAALITFIFNSFQPTEVRLTWIFLTRLESDVRGLLLGFASPERNAFHSAILDILPVDVQRCIPRTLGVFRSDGPPRVVHAPAEVPQGVARSAEVPVRDERTHEPREPRTRTARVASAAGRPTPRHNERNGRADLLRYREGGGRR